MMPKGMRAMGRIDVASLFPAAPGAEIHCVKVQTEWAAFKPRYVKINPEEAKWFSVLQIYVQCKPQIDLTRIYNPNSEPSLPAEVFMTPILLDMETCRRDETIEVRLRNNDKEPHMITVSFLGNYFTDEEIRLKYIKT